jgi:DNA polymerase-4
MRAILHVDMDAFYAAVEQRDDPGLRGLPLVVGGPSRRGVVCAASYEARRFGIRSAMPMVRAHALCRELVVVSPRFQRYAEVSEQVFSVFGEFTPLVEGLSLDEAFLDVTRSQALFGPPAQQALAIKRRIREVTQLTASVGLAEVKFAAKIASDLRKPDGFVEVPEGRDRAPPTRSPGCACVSSATWPAPTAASWSARWAATAPGCTTWPTGSTCARWSRIARPRASARRRPSRRT